MVAVDGIAGLRTLEDDRDGTCLVLSDVVMPNGNGIETAEAIRQTEPNAQILLMSGYRHKIPDLQPRERFAFIRKPFIHAVLIDQVRSVAGNHERRYVVIAGPDPFMKSLFLSPTQ